MQFLRLVVGSKTLFCTFASCLTVLSSSDVIIYRIIGKLETLKKEAAEVQRKVDETDVVMGEVERVSQQHMPLSSACSSIYFTLESLHLVGGV